MELWNDDVEIRFFDEALRNSTSPERVFYEVNGDCYACIPKRAEVKELIRA